jgi:hypothetical protein
MFALSFLPGFLRARASPTSWIDSAVIRGIALETVQRAPKYPFCKTNPPTPAQARRARAQRA